MCNDRLGDEPFLLGLGLFWGAMLVFRKGKLISGSKMDTANCWIYLDTDQSEILLNFSIDVDTSQSPLRKSNPKTFCVLGMIEFSSSNQHWGSDKVSVLPSATRPGGENKQKAGTNRFFKQLLKHWLRSFDMWFKVDSCDLVSCNMIVVSYYAILYFQHDLHPTLPPLISHCSLALWLQAFAASSHPRLTNKKMHSNQTSTKKIPLLVLITNHEPWIYSHNM